jgi:ribosomal protein S24E
MINEMKEDIYKKDEQIQGNEKGHILKRRMKSKSKQTDE